MQCAQTHTHARMHPHTNTHKQAHRSTHVPKKDQKNIALAYKHVQKSAENLRVHTPTHTKNKHTQISIA